MSEYLGFKEVVLGNDDGPIKDFIANGGDFGCVANEYLIVKDENDKEISSYKYDGKEFREVAFKQINNKFLGKIKPRNIQQRLALDMLYDPDTTVNIITGKAGSGKDYITCAVATDLITRGVYKKIVYVRNNVEVRNTRPIGFLPGESDDKLLPFAMPLADNLGGVDMIHSMMASDKLEIEPMGFIRGRGFRDSIIICDEAENITKDLAQLLISRIGENSVVWIIGDTKQVDAEVFRKDNGLTLMIDRFKGHPKFGYIKFLKTERSETAEMADLLD